MLIPASNVQHLMLRHDVVEAVREGKFHIYPVAHIDEGIELLTGIPAGARGADGKFPDGTINARVEARLAAFAEIARRYDHGDERRGLNGGSPDRDSTAARRAGMIVAMPDATHASSPPDRMTMTAPACSTSCCRGWCSPPIA